MPCYDYECKPCSKIKTEIHKMTENPTIKCSECQKPMTRLISEIGNISFKGKGWTPRFFRS